VPLVRARFEQLRERDLVRRGSVEVVGSPEGENRVGEAGRQHQPAEPQSRCERLARRPPVHDVLWVERLQRADRRPVEAELAVVVVLDEEVVAGARPGERGGAPLGLQQRRSGTDAPGR
jgi:hypothetical protein